MKIIKIMRDCQGGRGVGQCHNQGDGQHGSFFKKGLVTQLQKATWPKVIPCPGGPYPITGLFWPNAGHL